MKDEAKSLTEEGTNDLTAETIPEPVVTPEPEEGESKVDTKDFEQMYKTLVGQNQKLQKEYNVLKTAGNDFAGVTGKLDEVLNTVKEHGQTLNLVTDILAAGAEYNEELQGKITETKKTQEAEQKRIAEWKGTASQMGNIAKPVGLEPNDESLKPAWEAAGKGDRQEAIRLTVIAVEKKVSALAGANSVVEEDSSVVEEDSSKKVDKEKLKQLNVNPASSPDWHDLSPREKLLRGMDKRNKE